MSPTTQTTTPTEVPLPGTLVRLDGLKSAAGLKLNGNHALVTESTHATSAAGRASVLPLPYRRDTKPIALKLAALTPPAQVAELPSELLASYASAVRAHSIALLRADRVSAAVAQLDSLLAAAVLVSCAAGDGEPKGREPADDTGADALPTRVEILALRAYALRSDRRHADAVASLEALLAEPSLPRRLRYRAQCELVITLVEDAGKVNEGLDIVDSMLAELNELGGVAAIEANETTEYHPMEKDAELDDQPMFDDDWDDVGIELDGAIARGADESVHIAMHEENDDWVRRGTEAMLRVRPKNADALRALGHCYEREGNEDRSAELIKQADELDAAMRAAKPVVGSLVRISGLLKTRAMNGRYGTVTGIDVDFDAADKDAVKDVGVVLLPFEQKNGVAIIAGKNLTVVDTPCTEWAADLVDQYVDGVAGAAGLSMESATEFDVSTAQSMCKRVIEALRGVGILKKMPKLLFIYWVALRAGDDDETAERVREEVQAMSGNDGAGVVAEMERLMEEDRNAPPVEDEEEAS